MNKKKFLSEKEREEIRVALGNYEKVAHLAKRYNVVPGVIYKIKKEMIGPALLDSVRVPLDSSLVASLKRENAFLWKEVEVLRG